MCVVDHDYKLVVVNANKEQGNNHTAILPNILIRLVPSTVATVYTCMIECRQPSTSSPPQAQCAVKELRSERKARRCGVHNNRNNRSHHSYSDNHSSGGYGGGSAGCGGGGSGGGGGGGRNKRGGKRGKQSDDYTYGEGGGKGGNATLSTPTKNSSSSSNVCLSPEPQETESANSKESKTKIQTTHDAKLFNREYKRLRKEGLSNKDAMNQAASWISAPPKLRKSAI